jgi:hypothetical protein
MAAGLKTIISLSFVRPPYPISPLTILSTTPSALFTSLLALR